MKDIEFLGKTDLWKGGKQRNGEIGVEMALACIQNIRNLINNENLN